MPITIPATYRHSPDTPTDALRFLQEQTDNFGTFFSLDRIYYHMGRCSIVINENIHEMRALAGVPDLKVTNREAILNVLRYRFNIPDFKLMSKDNKLSTAASVIDGLVADQELSEEAHRFLDLFKIVNDATRQRSNLVQYSSLPVCKGLDFENERMVVAHPKWSLLSTSRFSAKEPSLQNIPRDIVDIYTAPKGWCMVFSDSGQIEPRITYSAFIADPLIKELITLYDDAYFGLLHFILMTPEEEAAARAYPGGLEKHEVTPEMKEKRQRLKVLGLAGNYGSSNLAAIDAELGPLYEEKIVSHPMRRQWEKQVSEEVRAGADHFYGYFGTPVYPEDAKKDIGDSQYWKGHVIRCGINNPIQTTASELMHLSILEAKKLLLPSEHIGAWKHDEGMIYVPADQVQERAPLFRECLSYRVENWIPINSDLHIGRKESSDAEPLF